MGDPRPPRRPAKKSVKATPKTATPRRQTPAQRDAKVLELREQGLTLAAIAKRLRFRDAGGVHQALERSLDRTLQPPASVQKRLQLEMLRDQEDDLWPLAESGSLAAIHELVKILLARNRIHATPESSDASRIVGPIETATAVECQRLERNAPALAAAALTLARIVDENRDPGPTATAARELRMTMSQLRGLAGTMPPEVARPNPDPGEEKKTRSRGKKPGKVVPESRLDQLRREAEARARDAAGT